MIFEAASRAFESPDSTQIFVAGITSLGLVIVAILGTFGARKFTHPRTPKRDPDERKDGHVSGLSSYNGEQNEFMKLVIDDSKELHARMNQYEAQLDELKKERSLIIGAFGRYVSKLVRAWGSGGTMPYPDTEDLALLEDTLPADWRRRR